MTTSENKEVKVERLPPLEIIMQDEPGRTKPRITPNQYERSTQGDSIYAIYNLSSFTIGGGGADKVIPLTFSESNAPAEFSLTADKITINQAGLYTISSSIRYDNIASGEEIVILSYKSTVGGTIYASTLTYFNGANDYATLTTIIKVSQGATIQVICNVPGVFSVNLAQIASLKILKQT